MKLGKILATTESGPVLGGSEQSVAEQEPNIPNAEPNDQKVNELASNTIETGEEGAAEDEVETQAENFDKALDNSTKASTDLDNAAQTLDELQDSANNIVVADGAISPVGSEIISQTLESIRKSLGLDKAAIPTIEAFKGKWSKKDASRVTMEKISGTKSDIVTRVISTMKSLFDTVVNFLMNLFKSKAVLEFKIKRQISRLAGLTKVTGFKSQELRGPEVSAFQYKNAVDLYTINKILDTADICIDYYNDINKAINSIRDSRLPDEDIRKVETKLGRATQTTITFSGEPVELYGAFINGKSLAYDDIGDGRVKVKFFTNIPEGTARISSMNALASNEISQCLNKALAITKHFREVESKFNTIRDAIRGVIRKIEAEYGNLRAAMGNADYIHDSKIREKASNIQSYLTNLVGRIPNQIFSACSHTADLAKLAINNLEGEKE